MEKSDAINVAEEMKVTLSDSEIETLLKEYEHLIAGDIVYTMDAVGLAIENVLNDRQR